MNRKEYLLECLAEEAAEIVQAKSKVVRFGEDDAWPSYEGTALTRLFAEMNDILAVIEILSGEVPFVANREAIDAKKRKVEEMFKYSSTKAEERQAAYADHDPRFCLQCELLADSERDK